MSFWKIIKDKYRDLTSDGVKLRPVIAPIQIRKAIAKKHNYIEWSRSERDSHGFIHGCDSLLFSALSRVGGYPVNLGAAEEDGRWFRRPSKDCYSSGQSKSTISRDMLVGMIWASYVERDVDRLKRFFNYSEAHKWIVGKGVLSRTIVTPQIQKLAADVLDKLGGGNKRFYRQLPDIYPEGLRGFEAHLQLLQILLRLHMDGKISKTMADRVHEHRNRNEFNCLAQMAYHLITDGNLSKPIDLCMGLSQLPNDRLPDNDCRSTEYLWQRELNDSWRPGHETEIYSGSDLIFAVGLMELFINRG